MQRIEKNKYQGYLWISNEEQPRLLNNEPFGQDLADNEVPFIVEGRLWCQENNTSVSIACIDGKYQVSCFKMDSIEQEWTTTENYRPHKRLAAKMAQNGMKGWKLSFRRLWKENNDPLCEDQVTLEPDALVFTGFIKDKEE